MQGAVSTLGPGTRCGVGLHLLVSLGFKRKYRWFWRGLARGPGGIRESYGPSAMNEYATQLIKVTLLDVEREPKVMSGWLKRPGG